MADTPFNTPDCSTHNAHEMVDKSALRSAGKEAAQGPPSPFHLLPKQRIGDIVAENPTTSIQVYDRMDPTVVRARTAVGAMRAIGQLYGWTDGSRPEDACGSKAVREGAPSGELRAGSTTGPSAALPLVSPAERAFGALTHKGW
ncbi:hypothetical protein V8E36_005110 [Tilletia maclaganii]